MKREIKFRIWYRNKMFYSEDSFSGSNGFIDIVKIYIGYGDDWDTARISPIMQYTGLKDTNGVEIYEGDIIKYYSMRTSVIIFDLESASFGFYEKTSFGQNYKTFRVVNSSDVKVIGNIYENPELLEDLDVKRLGGDTDKMSK